MSVKIQLFIAASLDGFIARENGSIDWLLDLQDSGKTDHGYNEFISGIGTIIMGRKTYEDLQKLVAGWPYPDHLTYVVTRNKDYEISNPSIMVLREINVEKIRKIRSESKGNIWLVGGGILISQFLNAGAVDELILSIIPLILGKGIPLFPDHPGETGFELVKAETWPTGVVSLYYNRKI